MTDVVVGALERADLFFRDRESWAAVVARRIMGKPRPDDARLADHLLRERRRRTRLDGSIGGSLVATAQAVWEMLELGAPPDNAGVVRMTGFLLGTQDQPGRWGEMEGRGTGFFSLGPPERPAEPIELTGGATFTGDDARLIASCLALRAVLRAGHDQRTPVRAHVEALLTLQDLPLLLAFAALGAAGRAGPDYHTRIRETAEPVLDAQEPDGAWPGVPLAFALEMLASVPLAEFRAAIRRSAPVAVAQTASGFAPETSDDVALAIVRALDLARRTG